MDRKNTNNLKFHKINKLNYKYKIHKTDANSTSQSLLIDRDWNKHIGYKQLLNVKVI